MEVEIIARPEEKTLGAGGARMGRWPVPIAKAPVSSMTLGERVARSPIDA